MNDTQPSQEELELKRLVRMLEAAPEITVPDDFASRVMQKIPQVPARRYVLRRPLPASSRYGRAAVVCALLILVAAMALLAPRSSGSPTWLLIQALLFVQLCGLLVWVGVGARRYF